MYLHVKSLNSALSFLAVTVLWLINVFDGLTLIKAIGGKEGAEGSTKFTDNRSLFTMWRTVALHMCFDQNV